VDGGLLPILPSAAFVLSVPGGYASLNLMPPLRLLRLWRHILVVLLLPLAARAAEAIPVIFDTDIGGDIDDAYALAQILRSPELHLLGVTTVSGDTVARARLAAKMLAVDGRVDTPVHAGISHPMEYLGHTVWAKDFASSTLHPSGAVEFMRGQINAQPGKITIIATGELTNIAALLDSEPGIGGKIKAIALMGGSVLRGYAPGSKPEPEWNIKSNAKAAQAVFSSGVPLLVAPLDSTADLKLTPEWKVRIFSRGMPLNDALASLDFIWRHTNTWNAEVPTLFDNLAVALVATPSLVPLTPMHITVDADGLTRVVADRAPNAQVALTSDPAAFLKYVTERLSR